MDLLERQKNSIGPLPLLSVVVRTGDLVAGEGGRWHPEAVHVEGWGFLDCITPLVKGARPICNADDCLSRAQASFC